MLQFASIWCIELTIYCSTGVWWGKASQQIGRGPGRALHLEKANPLPPECCSISTQDHCISDNTEEIQRPEGRCSMSKLYFAWLNLSLSASLFLSLFHDFIFLFFSLFFFLASSVSLFLSRFHPFFFSRISCLSFFLSFYTSTCVSINAETLTIHSRKT